MKRMTGVLAVALMAVTCGGRAEPIDEDAIIDAAQVAVGGPSGVLMRFMSVVN